jgi:hypothetical protein
MNAVVLNGSGGSSVRVRRRTEVTVAESTPAMAS